MTDQNRTIPMSFILRTIKNSGQVPFLVHGQRVSIAGRRRFPQDATVFTVVGFALDHGICPVAAVLEQKKLIEKEPHADRALRAFSLEGVMLTDQPETEIARTELSLGQVVSIEGCICRIDPDWNDNFAAVELSEQEIRNLYQNLQEAA